MEEKRLPHDHHTGAGDYLDHMPGIDAFAVTADVFKMLADPTRIRLFWLLCHVEECVTDLAAMMDMTSPAVSHHLKLLKACGLVTSRRDGKEVRYRAAENEQAEALHHIVERIAEISCPETK